MRKMLLTPLIVCIVALLSTLSIPVHATPPITASGTWIYAPEIIDMRVAGGNTFLLGKDVANWTGTFNGTSTEDFTVVAHRSGFMYYKGLVFFGGTVDGKSGTLVIRTVGKTPPDIEEWSGKWVILSGGGDLENLRGQGTWWQISPLNLVYSGKVHFDPK